MTNADAGKTTKLATPPTSSKTEPDYGKLRVGRELMDTTWRMTVPVLLFAGAGLLGDRQLGSKPWLTLLGTLVGFYFAALLVKRQIGNDPEDSDEPRDKRRKPNDT
jgi:hypothetical protein